MSRNSVSCPPEERQIQPPKCDKFLIWQNSQHHKFQSWLNISQYKVIWTNAALWWRLLTSQVKWICYAFHLALLSTNTPLWVEHQGETPMVLADPNDCPDLVAPGLTAFLETHIDSNMCHHSLRNKQIDDEVSVGNGNINIWNC